MLTPQEISTHVFQKATFGGYNMSSVDEFLDQMTEDYTTIFKENAALKAKMKVLVDKVEEYRSTEDAMRATLLTAQKMANAMVDEAKQKKEKLISEAEQNARVQINQLQNEIVAEQQRLAAAKSETAEFIATMRRVCTSELEFLAQVPEIKIDMVQESPEQKENKVEEKVESIEDAVKAAFGDTFKAEPAEEETEDEPAVEETAAPDAEEKFETEEEDLSATRRMPPLGDLKFGRNYSTDKE